MPDPTVAERSVLLETVRIERHDSFDNEDMAGEYVFEHSSAGEALVMWTCPKHRHVMLVKCAQEQLIAESDLVGMFEYSGAQVVYRQGPEPSEMPREP